MEQDRTQEFSMEDIEKNKVISALAYLGILFFLPLIVSPDSKFGKFHANQGLILLILSIVGNVIGWFIPFVGGIVSWVISLAVIVFLIMGIVNTLNGKAKELPIIGKYTLIK